MTRMIPVDKIERYRELVEHKASLRRSIDTVKNAGGSLRLGDSDDNGNLYKVQCPLIGHKLGEVVIAKLNDMIVEADIEMENLCVDTDE